MFLSLLRKEFLQIFRNAFLPRLIVVFPIVIMCVMPWVMNMEVKNIRLVVVDADGSALSRQLQHRIEASHYFRLRGMSASYAEALQRVEQDEADVILSIPARFESRLLRGEEPQMLLAANAVNGTKGSLGVQYLSETIVAALREFVMQHPQAPSQLANGSKTEVASLYLYNKYLNYKVFMVPALMAILVILLCGFLPALNVVGERESGTIEQINVTPVPKWLFILAKLLPYWLIGAFVMTLCFLLAWLLYGLSPAGSYAHLYFISLLLALLFSGMGLVVSNHSNSMQQAILVMWFFLVCMILLSGMFTPVGSMPSWARGLTLFNPVRHYIDAMRVVFVRGGNLAAILPSIGALALFALFFNTWAVVSYRKNE